MMRISECTVADTTLLRDTLFSYLQKVFYVSQKQIFTRFAPALLADVVWRWRPLLLVASLPGFAFSGNRTGKLARPS